MSSDLNEETTKDLMIKLFPKSSNEDTIQQRRVVNYSPNNQRIRRTEHIPKDDQPIVTKKSNKNIIAIALAVISVFILSPYVLNRIDDIASQRGFTLFNSKGEPTLIFLGVLVVIIGVINRAVIGFV